MVFYVVCKAVVYALFVEKAFLANKFMYKVRSKTLAPRAVNF